MRMYHIEMVSFGGTRVHFETSPTEAVTLLFRF